MSRARTTFILGLLAPLLPLALVGCSDDPEPKVAPEPTESASASVTPADQKDPTEPVMPAAAKKQTPAGAEAFVRYYVDVINFAQSSGDVADLRSASDKECQACAGYVQAIKAAYSGGGYVRGGTLSIGKIRALPRDYGADWGGFAKGTATKQIIVTDEERQHFPGGKFFLYAYTKWAQGSWRMHWMRTPKQ